MCTKLNIEYSTTCDSKINLNYITNITYITVFFMLVNFRQLLIMAMASVSTDHWQVDKSLAECNQFMLENNFYHDVTFTLDYKHMEET